jgi:P-type conjugative transfer protein TrbG
MKIRLATALLVTSLLGGCAMFRESHPAAPTKLVVANPTVEAPVLVNLPPPAAAPRQLKFLLPDEQATDRPATLPAVPALPRYDIAGVHAAELARASATNVAARDNYINAVAVYDFVPGQVYHVYTSPDFVTTIALRPGEKLISKVAGDTTRWTIGDTTTGDDSAPSTLVVLKPVRAGLHTNIVLATNQRVYFLDVESRPGNQYQNAISWNYPQEELTNMLAKVGHINQQARETVLTGVAIEDLNYAYDISTASGSTPEWMPKEVFDDGNKTYINFPESIGTTEAPPLFIRNGDSEADLVNYRVKGHFYIVDRLFDHAELRVGKDPQTIVVISRKAAGHTVVQAASAASVRPNK